MSAGSFSSQLLSAIMLHVNLILILIVIQIVHMSFASGHHLRQCVHDVTQHMYLILNSKPNRPKTPSTAC